MKDYQISLIATVILFAIFFVFLVVSCSKKPEKWLLQSELGINKSVSKYFTKDEIYSKIGHPDSVTKFQGIGKYGLAQFDYEIFEYSCRDGSFLLKLLDSKLIEKWLKIKGTEGVYHVSIHKE